MKHKLPRVNLTKYKNPHLTAFDNISEQSSDCDSLKTEDLLGSSCSRSPSLRKFKENPIILEDHTFPSDNQDIDIEQPSIEEFTINPPNITKINDCLSPSSAERVNRKKNLD
jgi:hypothetical protein